MHNNSTEGTARILEDNCTRRILSFRNSLDLNQIKQRARNTPALAEIFYKSSTTRQTRPQRIPVASSLGNLNNLYSTTLLPSEAFIYRRKPSNKTTSRSLSPEKLLTGRSNLRSIHQSLHTFQIKMSNRPSLTRYKLNS